MPSSTSSSDLGVLTRQVPAGPWLFAGGWAVVILALFVGVMELRLAARGIAVTVVDSPALWSKQRARASALGNQALILVGASRMQLDVDLPTLREATDLEPVQLAIDGSSFIPVLAHLADDPSIVGTVIVSYQDHVVATPPQGDAADQHVTAYENTHSQRRLLDFETSESFLEDQVRSRLRTYADGARPLTSLLKRILSPDVRMQYLVTLPDRSRVADYSRVPMPEFYFQRVLRNLGAEAPDLKDEASWEDVHAALDRAVGRLLPAEAIGFEASARQIAAMKAKIESRGGRVLFVVLPKSGLIREMDERRYPRVLFWDRFVSIVGQPTHHFMNEAELEALSCPDGSHLDQRDRVRFTEAWVGALQRVPHSGLSVRRHD